MTKAKKIFLIMLSIIIVIALLYAAFVGGVWYVLPNIGLGGAGDWSFDKIPGNYEIWRMHAKDVSLIKMFSDRSGGEKVLGPFILSFCWDQRYIGLQIDPRYDDPQEKAEIEYYIVDSSTEEVFGPFDQENYKIQSGSLGFQPNEWVKTVPAPEGVRR